MDTKYVLAVEGPEDDEVIWRALMDITALLGRDGSCVSGRVTKNGRLVYESFWDGRHEYVIRNRMRYPKEDADE